jgi:tRNA(Ile)-lysidine synthase
MTAPEGDTEPKGARFGVGDDLEARVRAGGLLSSGKPILVLLSGGRDSVCLLDLSVRIAGRGLVRALHVNYGLRDSAGDDETLCRELCERLDVPFEVRHPRRPEGNLQAWAREQRYAEAARSALARGALVASGHTASDQVETILYRLAASPGRRALLGMPARDGRLIRPLLEVTREETRAYCEERGLAWNEDPSNESPVYARNRVRHDLVAALRDIHPAAEENVLQTLRLLRDEAEVIDGVVDEALVELGDPPSVAALAALPPALARLAVQRLADHAAGGEAPAIQLRIEEIMRLGASGGTASLDLGRGLRAVVEYGRLRFDLGPSSVEDLTPVPLDAPGRALFLGGEVTAERGEDLPLEDGTLDAATLTTPLHVRAWRPGDRMRPLGLDGTRTLQDLFTDKKIPREHRHTIPIVLSDDEIAWIPGVATGERFRVTPATRDRVRLSWRPAHH